MIDLRKLRDNPDYREGAEAKGAASSLLDQVLELDETVRAQRQQVEQLQAESNAASKAIGRAKPEDRDAMIAEAGKLSAALKGPSDELDTMQQQLDDLACTIPNPAHESVPRGGEDDFEVLEQVGEPTEAPPMDHAEYGEYMGWIETEKAAINMGSRFAYLKGQAVLLEFALVQWTMAKLVQKGFTPVVTPVLVREDMMFDAGFFPTDRHQVYQVTEDDLFLTGTSEVALAGLGRGERFAAEQLPVRYAGFSSCFRREAGTYGKDTRGIFRVHQFDKVEMFSFCDPASSWDELEVLRGIEQEILTELGLPYRVIAVAAGDLGPAAAKKYDCEVWLPSEGRYRELTSCSNYLDYSARRMKTRVKQEKGTELVHTLNGTACAIGRTLVFLMENNQQADGSFVIPEALQQYAGGLGVIPPPDN